MKLWRALALTVLLAAGAALVWFAGSTVWSAGRERQALGAWNALGLPLPDAAAPLPKKETNAAARALEKVALPLGIDLRTRAESQAAEPERLPSEKELAKTEWGRTRGLLTKWATDQAERPEANVPAPPVEVAAWMTGHAAELDTIENGLVAGPAPEWAEDQSLLFAAPAPSMAGHMQLHVVLLGRALARAAGGDTAGAEHALLASWNLAAPERQRVDVPSRSIAWIATHLEMGVLRKLPVNAEPWRARLAGWDPHEAVKRSWANEAWTTWKAARSRQEGVDSGAPQGMLARIVGASGRRLEAAAFLDGWRAMTEAAVKSPVSDGDGASLADAFRKGLGRWAAAAPPIPNIGAAWKRADRLALEAELTNKVFDIRAKRDPSGAWPASIPGIEDSKAVNVKWTYAVTAEGRASVATNRVLNWPDRGSSILGWVSEPPAAKTAPAPKRR